MTKANKITLVLKFFVIKLVVCNHIRFNKVVIDKLNIIILNPINQVPRLFFLINLNFMCKHKTWIKFEYI